MARSYSAPTVSVNREPPLAELSYILRRGWSLPPDEHNRVWGLLSDAHARADVPANPTSFLCRSCAGFAMVPLCEVDELASEVRRIIATGQRRRCRP